MVNESNKIIVKVGKKSRVRFANSKVYRAITANDLSILTTKYDDCQIVIIENINKEEQNAVRDFAKSFKEKREGNTVLFYIPDNEDEITSGVADELDYTIYLTDRDLYKTIYEIYGINVSVYLDDKKRLNSQELSELVPEGMTDVFGGIGDESEIGDDISDAIAAIDEEDSKADVKKTDADVEDLGSHLFGTDFVGSDGDNADGVDDSSTNDEQEDAPVKEGSHIKLDKPIENTEVADVKKTDTDVKLRKEALVIPSEAIPADTAEYIEKLKMQIRDAKYDFNEAVKDMREANSRMTSLENTIRVLREERDAVVKRYEELLVSEEILEDPISLAEYSVIKENADSLESQVLDLKATIDSLKETIEEKDMDINSAETSIDELKETIEGLKSQLAEAQKSIESGEAFKEQIEEYEDKLKQSLDEKAKILARLNVVEEDNEKLQGNVSEVTIRADEEAETRVETLETLNVTLLKIKELSDKLAPIEKEKEKLVAKLEIAEKQLKSNKEAIRGHLETITKLEKSVADTDKRIELANSSMINEMNQLKDRLSQLQTKLTVTEQQLAQKENQYNTLVSASGMDENGANALVETNRTLETISKTLREQLGAANKELEKARRNESEATRQLSNYKAQVSTLQKSLQTITASGGGGGSSAMVRPINIGYSQAQIITVFGSGSFGITTTAMSLAQRLAATSKVLYIDFDLVSPMADSWFKINPMLSGIPGTMNGSIQNSGLGLFVEHGTNIINQYMNNIVKLVNKTKGGGLHYLSGLYYRPDTFKLASADYEGLFTLLSRNFQYIIVDFGRLGSSEVGDQLIKVISDIAYKNIVVTTTNQFEVRNFKTKLTNINIKLDSIAWLFNMCASTALEPKIKELISTCKYDMLPRMEQYGVQENFLRAGLTRDRFGLFVDRTVFGR